jgi:hypothetical protein
MILQKSHLTQVRISFNPSRAYWGATHAITITGDSMKPLRIALVGLTLPVALAAQQPQANPITAAFKTRIAASHRNIAQAFDSIPESKFGYKPTPAQLTVGFIAQHVASDSYVFCSNFGAMKPTIDAKDTSPSIGSRTSTRVIRRRSSVCEDPDFETRKSVSPRTCSIAPIIGEFPESTPTRTTFPTLASRIGARRGSTF